MMPGPFARLVVDALELLERAVALEHGVEVADEQHPRPLAGMVRDQVAGALERRAVDPGRLEPERVELLAEQIADRADAREVVRAAVDVDGLLEQRERARRCRRRRRTRSRARARTRSGTSRERQEDEREQIRRPSSGSLHRPIYSGHSRYSITFTYRSGLDLVAEALVRAARRARCLRTRSASAWDSRCARAHSSAARISAAPAPVPFSRVRHRDHADVAVRIAAEVVDGGLEEGEPERRLPPELRRSASDRALQAAVEEIVEAAHFPADDLGGRAPRRRPERREAPGRVDDEVAIGARCLRESVINLFLRGGRRRRRSVAVVDRVRDPPVAAARPSSAGRRTCRRRR